MVTLKLKKPPAPPSADRAPVRGRAGVQRPTLAQSQAKAKARTAPREPPQTAGAGAAVGSQFDGRPAARGAPRADARDPRAGTKARPPEVASASTVDARAATGSRLSKRMSELGLASRREADEWIAHGWVRVDGQVVSELGSRVLPHQVVTVDDRAAREQAQRVTVLLHKPLGVVSGQAEDGHAPAITLITAASRWSGCGAPLRFNATHLRQLAPAGRLDLDSSGLLVLTQDGRIARELIGEDSRIEKEYLVRVAWAGPAGTPPPGIEAGPLMHAFPASRLERMRHGLRLDGEALKPAQVSWQSEQQLRVVLREGKKRQIRRMCEAVGLAVVALKRIRIGRVSLGDLPPGQWRYLGPFERF